MDWTEMSEPTKAPELLDAAVEEPTLDEMMRRDPATLTTAERARGVALLRQDRAVFIKAEAERAARKSAK